MRLSIKLGSKWYGREGIGRDERPRVSYDDAAIRRYRIGVERSKNVVMFGFHNKNEHAWPGGGVLEMHPSVARRLGAFLVGALPLGTVLLVDVDERPRKTRIRTWHEIRRRKGTRWVTTRV